MALDSAVATLVPGDAVLSRLNAPLMGVCLGLLRRGVPARVEGRDIGQQLVGMVRKLKAKSVPDFLRKLALWGEKQVRRAQAGGGKHVQSKIELAHDQVATLTAISEGCQNVSQVEARITEIFQDSAGNRTPAVVCSSVHKAKGLEWDTVCLINSSFKSAAEGGEEANIFYVAVTRAKKTLIRGL
jgi:ATP-dependent exoDNAse (exonuclease V) beta subunit